MSSLLRLPLRAPGIYQLPPEPVRTLTGVRMDICAFVGVAPRGPAREPVVNEKFPADRPWVEPGRPLRRTVPVAVESFDEYRRLYGAFEGRGLLPYAVAAFFEQGGRRAYIARIVHRYANPAEDLLRRGFGEIGGCSASASPVRLIARNEGSWSDGMTASMTFNRTPVSFTAATLSSITFPDDIELIKGTRLDCTLESGAHEIRTITLIIRQGHLTKPAYAQVATLDTPLPGALSRLELIEGVLTVDDGQGRIEVHDHVGLGAQHPRSLGTLVSRDSTLVFPDAAWTSLDISPNSAAKGTVFQGGKDVYEDIIPEDFFDSGWILGNDEPGDGVYCFAHTSDLSMLAVPDLYSPFPLQPLEGILDPASLTGPEFAPCVTVAATGQQEKPVADLEGLRLDPRVPAELNAILTLQSRLEEFADSMRSFVILLDVPPGLSHQQVLRWRARFSSSFAVAYHPWLHVARRDDSRDVLIHTTPIGVAAGIIARSEIQFGIPHGPANVLAAEVVNVDDVVPPARHDVLHPLGINVFLRERDGIRLTAARTLSRDASYRQLSVRRLMTMIMRTLEQQTQWIVFEPNSSTLQADVRQLLIGFLRNLQRAGAFRGATEEESFFVSCDGALNTQLEMDAGRLIAEIGVAPVEPLEFIVLRIERTADGTLTVEE